MSEVLQQESIMNEEEDTQKNLYLIFNLDDEAYGVEIKIVTEMIGIQPIVELPEMPTHLRGIINLRGQIIPVLDIRMLFHKPFKEYDWRTCIIIINIDDITLGLIVDNVSEVISIPEENIVLPPSITSERNKYISGIGKSEDGVSMILDCLKLIEDAVCDN